ncbi:MAG: hypothetical protein IJ345_08455 [Clostridia bacterium]|nr:hypothetical protein [Clostridia bacterium]
MKKILALSLVLILIFSFVGCVEDNLNDTETTSEETTISSEVENNGVPALEEIKDCSEDELSERLIGFSQEDLHTAWGENDGMLSGFFGETWSLSHNKSIIVYYDKNSKVMEIKIHVQKYDSFAQFLDYEHFVPDISQGNYIYQMGNYSYDGTAITDLIPLCHYDGPLGGGCEALGELFGFRNDYTEAEDGKSARYTNSFYTKVLLDSLTMPYDVTFEDTLTTVLQKLGFAVDPYKDFVSDKDAEGIMTLYRDDKSSIVLKLACETEAPSYELIYTENYTITSREITVFVTRSVTLMFNNGENKLEMLCVSVDEDYSLTVLSFGYVTYVFEDGFVADFNGIGSVLVEYQDADQSIGLFDTVAVRYYEEHLIKSEGTYTGVAGGTESYSYILSNPQNVRLSDPSNDEPIFG